MNLVSGRLCVYTPIVRKIVGIMQCVITERPFFEREFYLQMKISSDFRILPRFSWLHGKRLSLLLMFQVLLAYSSSAAQLKCVLTVISPLSVPQQWIYGSISNGDLQKNSFIGMAYGPPTKKPKIHNEAANQRELSPQSNGMSILVIKTNVRALF